VNTYWDTHTHLATEAFDGDRPDALERARAAGVQYLIAIGAGEGLKSNRQALDLAQNEEGIFATLGLHPHDASLWNSEFADEIISLSREAEKSQKIIAWGEIGLDYHYHYAPPEKQKQAFEEQIQIAWELNLPLVIHTREAEEDTLAILHAHQKRIHAVEIHCFSGTSNFAQELQKMAAYIGVGGIVTFKQSEKLRQTVSQYPMDKILLETDCPYLAPVPFRGKRNEPAYIPLIAAKLAELQNIDVDRVAQTTQLNAQNFFPLPAQSV